MKKKDIIDHELITLLRSFTNKELRNFGLFLSSPYFSKRKTLSIFYNELIKYHPLYTHIKLTKESLYNKVYKRKVYKDSSVRDLFTETINAAKNFLAHESFSADRLFPVHKLRQLRLRSQHHLFKKQLRKSNSELRNYGGVDSVFFLYKFNLDVEKHNENLLIHKLTTPKKSILIAREITESNINIIIYSVLEVISNYIALLIQSEKSRVVKVDKFMVDAVRNLEIKKLYEHIKGKSKYDYIIEIYYLLLIAYLKRGNWNAYNNFKRAASNNFSKIGHNETADLYSNMIRISILGAKTGDNRQEFDIELLNLYDTFLRNKYFRDNKSLYIQTDLYRAIVFQAVKMNSIDWLKTLIKDSGPWLNPESRDSLLNYAISYYSFARGDYNSALDTINKVDIEYYIFKYDLYILKLKVFFESGEMELALDLILAFRQFIATDKLMQEERKENYRSFTKFLEKIIRISSNSTYMDADTLLLKFQKSKNVINAEWLLEKIQNLQENTGRYSRSV